MFPFLFRLLLALALSAGIAPASAREALAAPGIPWIETSALPAEALQVLGLIERGGPFQYRKDGSEFRNRERLLPLQGRGYYREYTVPTPGSRDRGARRIVAGVPGEYYYTADHYRSFKRIRR